MLQNFVPTLPGASPSGFATAAGTTAAPDQAAGANPLGLFATILDGLVHQIPVVGALLPTADATAPDTTPDQPLIAPLASLLKPEPTTLAPQQTAATPKPAPDVPDPPRDLEQLVSDLADLLAAYDTAIENGEEPDPAIIEKLTATLDEIAVAIGLAAPPATQPLPASGEPAIAPVGTQSSALAGILPAAPQQRPAAQPATADTPAASEQTPLDQIGAALARIADRMTNSGRDVPGKLAEVAAAFTNPALAPAIMSKLGLEAGTAIAEELAQLLPGVAKPTTAAPTPQGQIATPELKAPTLLVPPEQQQAQRPAPKPADAPAPDRTASQDARIEPATKPDTPRPVDIAARPPTAGTPLPTHQPDPSQQANQSALAIQQAAPATVRAIHAAYATPPAAPPQLNLPQLAAEIVGRFQAGNSKFQIRLDPPELGRIDVRMDVDQSGTVNARLTVERAETLDLLQRDQRQLERALQQAGLDGSKTSLEFNLRQQQHNPFDRNGQPQQQHPSWMASRGEPAGTLKDTPDIPLQFYRATGPAGGINIFA